jgi:hypothetical protein
VAGLGRGDSNGCSRVGDVRVGPRQYSRRDHGAITARSQHVHGVIKARSQRDHRAITARSRRDHGALQVCRGQDRCGAAGRAPDPATLSCRARDPPCGDSDIRHGHAGRASRCGYCPAQAEGVWLVMAGRHRRRRTRSDHPCSCRLGWTSESPSAWLTRDNAVRVPSRRRSS